MPGSRIVKRGLIAIGIVVGLIALEQYYNDSIKYDNCQIGPEWFNAKPVTYQGKTYQVKVCGDGAGVNGAPESIKLSVYAPDGKLVAVRRFTANFLGFVAPLEYKPEGIRYLDDENGFEIIPMPPTWQDWVKARIPLISGSQLEWKKGQEAARATVPQGADTVFDPDEQVIPK